MKLLVPFASFFTALSYNVRRYPFAVLVAFLCTLKLVIMIGDPIFFSPSFVDFAQAGIFAFLLFTLFHLIIDYQEIKDRYAVLFCIGGIVLSVLYFYSLGGIDDFHTTIRSIIFSLSIFLLLFLSPFFHSKEIVNEKISHYTSAFILILLQTVFYGILVYFGLILAVFAFDTLFAFNIDENIYLQIWILVVGLFCTNYALFQIPKKEEVTQISLHTTHISFGMKYIIFPLIILYFIILYSYVAKILFTQEWPNSLLGSLIVVFTLFSLMFYFLSYEMQKHEKWMKNTFIILLVSILPLAFLLFWTLYIRISEYGLTANRYFMTVYGLWILGIALYYLVSKKKDLRWMIVSFACIAVFTSFGPWGAFEISAQNQLDRLEQTLQKNQILQQDGTLVPLKDSQKISQEDIKIANGAIDYLIDYHGVEILEQITPHFHPQKIKAIHITKLEMVPEYSASYIKEALGLPEHSPDGMRPQLIEGEHVYRVSTSPGIRLVEGFTHFVPHYENAIKLNSLQLIKKGGEQTKHEDPLKYEIYKHSQLVQTIDFDAYAEKLHAKYENAEEILESDAFVEFDTDLLKIKFLFSQINVKTNEQGKKYISSWTPSEILVKLK